jgi:hypothetical protein
MTKNKTIPRITNAKELREVFDNLTPKRKKSVLDWLEYCAYNDANNFVLDRNTVNGDDAWKDYNVLDVCRDYFHEHLFIKLIDGDIYNQTEEEHDALCEFFRKSKNIGDFEHGPISRETDYGDGKIERYYSYYYVLATPSVCKEFLTDKNS